MTKEHIQDLLRQLDEARERLDRLELGNDDEDSLINAIDRVEALETKIAEARRIGGIK